MKIIITGSLGNISKPLATALAQKGHEVVVVSSSPEKQKDIEALGARAAIGNLKDADFVTATFTGADAVYCMIPFSFSEPDQIAYFQEITHNYVQAIRKTGVKRVIHLSGWAVEAISLAKVEKIFDELPGIGVTHMRPCVFYTNFLNFISPIKNTGVITSTNYGGEDKIALVSPYDIADAALEELETAQEGAKIRYVASDEHTCNEVAHILGAAIGKPDLKWMALTEQETLERLKMAKLPEQLAVWMVEMGAAMHSGKVQEAYYRNRPKQGKVKLADFAKEFATAYNQK
jgi:NAD(P)H dehydrogenase (quinone)